MSEMNISLKGPEDALEFVRRVEKYPYTMDLCCGSIVVFWGFCTWDLIMWFI